MGVSRHVFTSAIVVVVGTCAVVADAAPAWAQSETRRNPLSIVENDTLSLRATLGAGINFVGEKNLFWNFTRVLAPTIGYNPDKTWVEAYIEPGLAFTARLTPDLSAYGQLSAIMSGTRSLDAYEIGNTGRVTLEQAHLGLRYKPPGTSTTFDISAGAQDYKVGTGMLIANGASNGFERGALKLGPRKAWQMTAIGRISDGPFSLEGFYLDPNERSRSDQNNKLAGATFRYDPKAGTYAGLTYANVFRSDAPWIRAGIGGAAPTVLPGAREGVSNLDAFGRMEPFSQQLPGFFISAEAALQWSDRINQQAYAGRIEIGRQFANLPWQPTIWYTFQTFSGDKPGTTRNERFDPLFYEGAPSAWATGSKSSMVFINSNVHAHQLTFRLTPTPKDIVTFRYAHIRVNELRSPIQFGQATRVSLDNGVPTLLTGVTKPHLADDFFLEYTRVVTPNQYLTLGASISLPGPGIRQVTNGRTSPWSGAFANYVVQY